jgi:hypothetical protein
MNIENLLNDEYINRKADIFASILKQSVQKASNEEDIKIAVESEIRQLAKEADLELEAKYEFTVAKGRIDSAYDRVFIEYKNPKSSDRLSANPNDKGNQKVVEQIKSRFAGLKEDLGHPPESLFGVGCDGNYFIFVRYRNNQWDVQDPIEVNKYTSERFLRVLFNLGISGKPFVPEYLAKDFGSEGTVAQSGIKTLYETICNTDNPKAQTFFQQWKILFGQVCGYDVNISSEKIIQLGAFYGIADNHDLKAPELLFSVHSYYALFIKLLAAEIVVLSQDFVTSPHKKMLRAATSKKLKDELERLESGSIFKELGIVNFLEGDLFAWYLLVWNEAIAKLIREMVSKLDEYNPATLSEEPAKNRDLLKKLYQQLFPKSLRHDLGEYYTPDWLAEHTLNRLEYDGNPDQRLLDPSCGSGTFLVMTIAKIRHFYEEHREDCNFNEGELCQKILNNVIGFDLNPLAVMAARTNYLVAIRDLVRYVDRVEIPIYLCDSIMTPSEYGSGRLLTETGLAVAQIGSTKELKTAVASFYVPTEITTSCELVSKYAQALEDCVRDGYSQAEFIEHCQDEGLAIQSQYVHESLYRELVKLDQLNQNGIWARIIKNAFAPLFIGKVDFVIGNPPWVNYEHLPGDYRHAMAPIWNYYELFPKGGWRARFAKGNTDLAMIFTYSAIDNYLKENGKLGFVLTQSIFQSGSASGYRRFKIHINKKFNIQSVDDMSSFQPFDGATNRTAILVCTLDRKGTSYPVPYTVWSLKNKVSISSDNSLEIALKNTECEEKSAYPISDEQSPWMVLPKNISKKTIEKIQKGRQEYKAWKGSDTRGGNGLFWMQALHKKMKTVICRNTPEFSKKKPPEVTQGLDTDLLYPLLKGKEVSKWHTQPEYVLLYPHEGNDAIPESEMKRKYPKTYSYFYKMREYLKKRKMYDLSRRELAFYSLFETGEFLVKPYKVVWKYIASELCCAVQGEFEHEMLSNTIVIPDHKLVIIPFEDSIEAHYVCGCLNSSPSRFVASTYIVSTQISTHILEYIKVPKFSQSNPLHLQIAKISQQCHTETIDQNIDKVLSLEADLDTCVAKLWKLTSKELQSIQEALQESQKDKRAKVKKSN